MAGETQAGLFTAPLSDAVSAFQGLFGQAVIEGKKALTIGGTISADAAAALDSPPRNGAEVQAPIPTPVERDSKIPGMIGRNPMVTLALAAAGVYVLYLLFKSKAG